MTFCIYIYIYLLPQYHQVSLLLPDKSGQYLGHAQWEEPLVL